MKQFFLIFSMAFYFIGCSGDGGTDPEHLGTIKGKITDSSTGMPIKDANIQTEPPTFSATSDSLGDFIISDVEARRYVVTANKVCYNAGSVEVTVIVDTTIPCDISLTKLSYSNTWDMSKEYSTVNNPNGVWSYGRKWSSEGNEFDLMTVRWGDSGWYLGNWGHGGPSIQSGPNLWAKNNTNGLPVVRWISPISGYYNLSSTFTGIDSRGVDVTIYITLNDSIIFTDNIKAYLDSTEYSLDFLHLNKDDYIDFLIKWNGGIYYEYSWTIVNGIINKYVGE